MYWRMLNIDRKWWDSPLTCIQRFTTNIYSDMHVGGIKLEDGLSTNNSFFLVTQRIWVTEYHEEYISAAVTAMSIASSTEPNYQPTN